MINEEMMKSLTLLIDETLVEIEDLKKSDRFSASEIKIDGPGSGIGGQEPNGKLGKEEDDKEEDEEDEEEKKKKEMDKAEGKNREADPNGGNHQAVAKGDDDEEEDEEEKKKKEMDKAEGKNREADPNGGHHKGASDSMEKSIADSTTLLKSYVDERIVPIEGKLEKMMNLIKEIADAPVSSKGASYKNIAPLNKSSETESLTKSQVIDKLFDLKKSGTEVNTTDIISAELGNPTELQKLTDKYNLN